VAESQGQLGNPKERKFLQLEAIIRGLVDKDNKEEQVLGLMNCRLFEISIALELFIITSCRCSIGRPRRRWVDNIRMDLGEWDGVIWTGLVWLRIGTGGELL
jgi:hypothetical protein